VGNTQDNTGEERGYVIDTATNLWERYSLYKKGRVYQVVVSEQNDNIIGHLFFDIHPPIFEYMVLSLNGTDKRWVSGNESIRLKPSDSLKIVDIKSNVAAGELDVRITGRNGSVPIRVGQSITGAEIVPFLEEQSNRCGIQIVRDKIFLALLPLSVVDYRPESAGTGHTKGNQGEQR
jgi:hypothetical protein